MLKILNTFNAFFGIAFCSALLTGCAINPVTGKNEITVVPVSTEIQLGDENFLPMQQAQGGKYLVHPEIIAYVSQVGEKLAAVSDRPDLPFEFVILNDSVPNAWTLPGGKIAVNRGLLTELDNEAELAAVLSHEIVHATARHGAKSLEKGALLQAGVAGVNAVFSGHQYEDIILGSAAVGAQLITLKYSRNAELEADHYGMKYMSRAGYDLSAAVTLQKMFLKMSDGQKSDWIEGLFATHPPSQERIEANQETLETYVPGGFLGKEEYKKAIAPLIDSKEAYAFYDKGVQSLEEGGVAQAIDLARKAIAKEPKEALFHGLLGKAKFQNGDLAGALASINEALRLNGEYYEFHLVRGLIMQSKGDKASAKRDLEASIALLPTAEAHYALGQIDSQEGNIQAAIAHFQTASGSPSERKAGEERA